MNTELPIQDKITALFTADDFPTQKAAAMFEAWKRTSAKLLTDSYDILAVEKEFVFPLQNPETEAPSLSFVEAGKIDGILRHKVTGVVCVLEHKTTGESIGAGEDYWVRLQMDTQISKYLLAARHLGYADASHVVYDVLKKPAQKQLRANKENPETPAEYYERVLNETLLADPAAYFVQREIPRSGDDLLEYMNDAWAMSQQLLYARRHNLFPRNTSACATFGRCQFFDLCAGRAEVDGIAYRKKERLHPELSMMLPNASEDFQLSDSKFHTAVGGKSLLTSSSMRCYRECPRKYRLTYGDGVESVSEEAEALHSGILFHNAAELYLSQFITK